jgi:hypothetical protein
MKKLIKDNLPIKSLYPNELIRIELLFNLPILFNDDAVEMLLGTILLFDE